MEDVVFRFHGRVARLSAVGEAFGIGRKLVRGGILVEHRISPPSALRESLAVFFDDESFSKDVWHIHYKWSLRTFLRFPLELDDHRAIREWLAVDGNAGFERFDHRRIGDDHLQPFVGSGGRDDSPILVPPEVGERDSAWRSQRVLVVLLVLCEKGCDAEDGEHYRGDHKEGKAGDTLYRSAGFYLLFLLFLRHGFRQKLRHGVFSSTEWVSSRTIAIRPDVKK